MPDDPAEKPPLKDASQNPWYVLMTVAGEQAEDAHWRDYDKELHAKNRRYFNGWMAPRLLEKHKARLIKEERATKADLAPLTDEERKHIDTAWRSRCPDADPPHRNEVSVKLEEVELPGALIAQEFLFSGEASFKGTTFPARASFRGATFARDALFQSATFTGGAWFDGVTFSGQVRFQDAEFSSSTYFDPQVRKNMPRVPTRFMDSPPQFFEAKLHEDTAFTDVSWPNAPDNRDKAIQHRHAYERLKLLMADQKKVADEHFFLRRELMCKEVEEAGTWTAWASKVFGWLCDYGWDPVKPGGLLLLLVAVGWALIFIAEWWDYHLGAWPDPEVQAEYLGFWQSGTLSLSNVFAFLGFSRTFLADEVKTLTAVSEVISGFQTVTGLVLFFLFGLALRNRFRLK